MRDKGGVFCQDLTPPKIYMLGERPTPQEQADATVTEYSVAQAMLAFEHLQKQVHGEGCGCPNCKKEAVSDWNRHADWMGNDLSPRPQRFEIDTRGEIVPETPPSTGNVKVYHTPDQT